MEQDTEPQRNVIEGARELTETEQRLLQAQEGNREATRAPAHSASDVSALRDEARSLSDGKLHPQADAEQRLLQTREIGPRDTTEPRKDSRIDPARAEVAEQEKIEHLASALRSFGEFRPEEWERLGDRERIAALDKAAEAISKEYGIEKPALVLEHYPDSNTKAYYDDNARVIHINRAAGSEGHPLWEDPREMLDTVAHEVRHAFQHDVARDAGKEYATHTQAEAWHNNLQHYIDPEKDFYRYWTQPVEVDARSFASQVRIQVYGK